jgi:hypothetical protein
MRSMYLATGALTAAVLSMGVSCNPAPPTPPGPMPAGSLVVSLGFGAVQNPPYQCTGQGNVTIKPQRLIGNAGRDQPQTLPFAYSGYSSSSSPACRQDVTFRDLKAGDWQLSDGTTTCAAKVLASQMTTVKIHHQTCQ